MTTRRDFLTAFAASAGTAATATMPVLTAALAPSVARAQSTYPDRPIRFYASFPPGGVSDIVARVIAQPLGERLGQPVIVDNRAGAGGVIGVDAVAKSAPDGYSMGFGVSGALTSSVTLQPKLPYDPTRDIAPVTMVILNPLLLTVNGASKITNVREFIAAAKAAPGKFTYGTAGAGTAMNLAGELLKQSAGFDMLHVAYKGSAPAAVDLLGGQVTAAILDLATAKPHLQSGRIRALGVTSPKRTPLAPDIPTIAEAGVPGYEFLSWFGLIMPAGTPPEILDKVHAAMVAVLTDPAVSRQMLDAGTEPTVSTPQEMAARIRREIDLTARLIKQAGIQVG